MDGIFNSNTTKVSWSHNLGTFQTGTEPFRWVSGKLIKPSNPGAFGVVNELSLYFGGMTVKKWVQYRL